MSGRESVQSDCIVAPRQETTEASDLSGETTFVPGPETEAEYRRALGCFGTGVTVVTHMTENGPIAMTANSFASVSLDPPLVLWCAAYRSRRHALFAQARHYAIHVMRDDQLHLARHFARRGHDFSVADWTPNAEGQPVLSDSLASFECVRDAVHPVGDHSIIVGHVLRCSVHPGSGLLFKRGQYGGFSDL